MSRWVASLYLLVVFLAEGCADPQILEINNREQAVQDCILAGGHARLGPGDTILCE